MSLHVKLLAILQRGIVSRRGPDVVIGGSEHPYMLRWWVIPRNPVFNVYLHHFRRSDEDEALHDHPWWNVSYLLDGDYIEVVPQFDDNPSGDAKLLYRSAGDIVYRRAVSAHRVVLRTARAPGFSFDDPDTWQEVELPVWTLFITGPRIRVWGFWCPRGWKPWKDFVALRDQGRAGCGEDE